MRLDAADTTFTLQVVRHETIDSVATSTPQRDDLDTRLFCSGGGVRVYVARPEVDAITRPCASKETAVDSQQHSVMF